MKVQSILFAAAVPLIVASLVPGAAEADKGRVVTSSLGHKVCVIKNTDGPYHSHGYCDDWVANHACLSRTGAQCEPDGSCTIGDDDGMVETWSLDVFDEAQSEYAFEFTEDDADDIVEELEGLEEALELVAPEASTRVDTATELSVEAEAAPEASQGLVGLE